MLIYRFIAINTLLFAFVALAGLSGKLEYIFLNDTSYISYGIAFVFWCGFLVTCNSVRRLSAEVNLYQSFNLSHTPVPLNTMTDESLKLRYFSRISYVRHIGSNLVLLGLIGTVIGFIYALSGVDASSLGSLDTMRNTVGTLIKGLGVAMTTTLVGSVLYIWTMINHQLMSRATAQLISTIMENRACGEVAERPNASDCKSEG